MNAASLPWKKSIAVAFYCAMVTCNVFAQTFGVSSSGTAVIPAYHAIPTQNYAVLDLSAATNQNYGAAAVALDDNNNVSFTFDSNNNVSEYTFHNGILSLTQSFSVPSDVGSAYVITGDGRCFYPGGDAIVMPGSGILEPTTLEFINNNPSDFGPPDPPYNGAMQISDAEDYGYAANCEGMVTVSSSIDASGSMISEGGVISYSGTTVIFDPNVASNGTSCAGMQVVNSDFYPFAVTANGWALGYDDLGNTFVWTATGILLDLPSIMVPVAINDAGIVVGNSFISNTYVTFPNGHFHYYFTQYVWTSGSGAMPLSQLIPEPYRNEILPYQVLDISGTDSNGNSRILFTGFCQSDAQGDEDFGDMFVLTLTSGTQTYISRALGSVDANDATQINSNGLITAFGVYSGDPNSPSVLLLLPVTLVLSGSNIGQYGWIPGTSNTPPNVSKLMSPPFYMTATAKSIPGVTGSLNILQDCDVTSAKVTYTDGSWTSCQPSGWLADYNPWWLPTQSGPNAQGNLTCTSSDQPRLPLSTAARNQVSSVLYSGSLRDFVTLQISGSTQVIAEAVWSFNMSASFTPDGVFQSLYQGVEQISNQPTVPGTVYGVTPPDQPVQPRTQSGNDYILNSANWHPNGNNQNDLAHQHPYPIPQ